MILRSLQIALAASTLLVAANASAADTAPAQRDMAEPEVAAVKLVSATAEVGAGTSKSASSLPASTFFYQRLGGRAALGSRVIVNASLTMNEDLATAATPPVYSATSADKAFFGTAGATVSVTNHIDVGLQANGSPSSMRDVGTTVSLKDGRPVDALVKVDSSSYGGTASVSYDSADDEAHEVDVGIDASASVTEYSADSTIAHTALYAGAPPAATFPQSHTSLTQTRLSAGATFTIQDDTDLGASAAYYIYDQKDPGAIGTYDALGGSGASYGVGAPILPPRMSIRPEMGHRFGALSVRAYYEFSDLAAPGVSHTVGGRIQVAVTKSVKLYALSSYRATPAPDTETSHTWNVGLGITGRF